MDVLQLFSNLNRWLPRAILVLKWEEDMLIVIPFILSYFESYSLDFRKFLFPSVSHILWTFNLEILCQLGCLSHLLYYIKGEHENHIKVYSPSHLSSILGKLYISFSHMYMHQAGKNTLPHPIFLSHFLSTLIFPPSKQTISVENHNYLRAINWSPRPFNWSHKRFFSSKKVINDLGASIRYLRQ